MWIKLIDDQSKDRAINRILVILHSLRMRVILVEKDAVVPGGVLPYMGYRGTCGPKGYGFSAVLVTNRVSIWPYWS